MYFRRSFSSLSASVATCLGLRRLPELGLGALSGWCFCASCLYACFTSAALARFHAQHRVVVRACPRRAFLRASSSFAALRPSSASKPPNYRPGQSPMLKYASARRRSP